MPSRAGGPGPWDPPYLRHVGHVRWVGVGLLDVRRVDGEHRLLGRGEAALGRLGVGAGVHGRRSWGQAGVVDGRLLLGAGQVEGLGRLMLMGLRGETRQALQGRRHTTAPKRTPATRLLPVGQGAAMLTVHYRLQRFTHTFSLAG